MRSINGTQKVAINFAYTIEKNIKIQVATSMRKIKVTGDRKHKTED